MIQLVADYGVFLAEKRLEQATVRIEAARVQDRVVHPQKRAQSAFQILVDALRAADETHRCHAEAPRVQAFFGRRDETRVVGKAKVIVRAEIQ